MRTLAAALSLMLLAAPAHAVLPKEMLDDPALEARARALSQNVRCLVCQNQSIDDSNAELAADLRVLIRERLIAGDSDGEVLDFLVARYGDFVLLKPQVKGSTYALYYGPAVLLVLGAIGVALYFRRRRAVVRPAAAQLSAEEQERLRHILEERGEAQ